MKRIITRISIFLLLVFTLSMVACSGSKSSAATTNKEKNTGGISANQANLSLADYLKRVPGVRIQGQGSSTKVQVRGVSAVGGNSDPLFVIDGAPIGNSYAQASSMVDVNDVDKIRVLKDASETSSYGLQGANGVILIKTKKN